MNESKYFKLGAIFLSFFMATAIVYVIFDGAFADFFIKNRFYGYSLLLGILAILLTLLILYKTQTFPPSIVLFASFCVAPIIGPFGNRVFEKLYGLFHGTHLDFAYPTFVWAVGTVALLAGILFCHYFIRIPFLRYSVNWNPKRVSLILWFIVGVASLFTFYALLKIGYIPLLAEGLGEARSSYEGIVGDYPLKFTRMWLLAASISSMLVFMRKPRKLYFVIILVSFIALMIYGQRVYTFTAIVSFVLIYCKFCRPKFIYLSAVLLLIVVAFILYAEFRSDRSKTVLSVSELVTLQFLGEWREYSLVVNELRDSGRFYEEEIFIGALAPIFPKQIWAVFGIDKNKLIHEYSAVYVFGRKYNNPILGIRIGTIGEAYAGYGILYGVCLQLFLFGLIIGILEKVYLNLKKEDARLCLICFLLSLFMYLPIATLYTTMAHAVFFGFFYVSCQLLGAYRAHPQNRVDF